MFSISMMHHVRYYTEPIVDTHIRDSNQCQDIDQIVDHMNRTCIGADGSVVTS